MHYLYIIFSKALNRYYVGESKNPSVRVKLHNQHHFKKGFTNAADDWTLVFEFECINQSSAKRLEKFVKRMKSRTFIEKIINDKNILEDIYNNKI